MENSIPRKNNIFFFEDFSAKELNENKVGRKGLSLFTLKEMDVPVPEFFVVGSHVFTDFCMSALEKDKEKLLEKGKNPENEEVQKSLLSEEFSKEVQEDILSAYTRLSGFSDAWVSVRSSVVFPANDNISFSGIFSTELNVRKYEDLKTAIKKVYSSLFTDDVVAYANKMDIDLAEVRLSVVVQKMIQAEISGVVFTVDPITQDETKLGIEAVYGLGDVISTGEITPDSYLLNKRDLNILEKHIAPQEWMKIRTMSPSNSRRSKEEKIKISAGWSHKQKLNDKDIQEISKIALIIENKSRTPQNIEWVISGGRAWILQNKPLLSDLMQYRVKVSEMEMPRKSLRDLVLAFLDKYKTREMLANQAVNDAQKMVMKQNAGLGGKIESLINAAKAKKEGIENAQQMNKDDLLVSGIGASFGIVSGKISIVDQPNGKLYTKQDILLIKRYSTEMESMIIPCGGVIMDYGGITSDTAILCREFKIPAIVGATNASTLLKDGDMVKIDGNTGSVYRDVLKEEVHPVVETYGDGIDLMKTQEEEIKVEEPTLKVAKDTTLPPSATRVFSMTNLEPSKLIDFVGNAHGLVYVDLDEIMIADGRHLLAYVEDRKFLDYAAKIAQKVIKYVELAEGNEVVLSIGSATIGQFKSLTRGKEFEDQTLSSEIYGATHYVNNLELLKRTIKIVKRIRNIYKKRNVSIALHSPMNEDMMKEFKKQLSGEGLRRTSSFKVYAILDNPSEIILADDILNTKIDGLILNIPRIAKQMQGFKIGDDNAKYDLSRNSVFRVVDNVIDMARNRDTKIISIVEDCKPLLRHCVQAGVYGVSVCAEDIAEARKVVSEEETKLILGR
jgi:pyruvate, water dikinase